MVVVKDAVSPKGIAPLRCKLGFVHLTSLYLFNSAAVIISSSLGMVQSLVCYYGKLST